MVKLFGKGPKRLVLLKLQHIWAGHDEHTECWVIETKLGENDLEVIVHSLHRNKNIDNDIIIFKMEEMGAVRIAVNCGNRQTITLWD